MSEATARFRFGAGGLDELRSGAHSDASLSVCTEQRVFDEESLRQRVGDLIVSGMHRLPEAHECVHTRLASILLP